jgi:glucose dehydrogenase
LSGVTFAGAMNGHFRTYDAKTGKVLWDCDKVGVPTPSVSGQTAH